MGRPRTTPEGGSTTRRGYDGRHKAEKARRLALARTSDPCARCGRPLRTLEPSAVHLDHTDDRTGYLGLSHAACNTSAPHRRPVLEPRDDHADARAYCLRQAEGRAQQSDRAGADLWRAEAGKPVPYRPARDW